MPSGPVSAVSAGVADRLLRRAAARLPLRLVYPDGTVIGAADPQRRPWSSTNPTRWPAGSDGTG